MVGPVDQGPEQDPETDQTAKPKAGRRTGKEGRTARHFRMAKEVSKEPRRIVPLLRSAIVEAWRLRGGGFYGLGYLLALVYLQVDVFVGDVMSSEGVGDFALGTLFEYLLRFSLMAFLNVFLALLWPLYILEHTGGLGIILLVLGYVLFEYALKPVVEQLLPELRDPASQNPEQ